MLNLPSIPAGWLDGHACAVATITATGGSTPRPTGTSMLVRDDGAVLGSLSGGCVEGAVVASALEALESGAARRESFGYSPEDAFAVGLTCGGELAVHIEPLADDGGSTSPAVAAGDPGDDGGAAPAAARPGARTLAALAALGPHDPVALVRRVDAGGSGFLLVPAPQHLDRARLRAGLARILGSAALAGAAEPQVAALAAGGRTGVVRPAGAAAGQDPCPAEPPALLVESRLAPPRMLVFGANDFAEALLPIGRLLGYRTTLCDARAAFTHQPRFAAADGISTAWPHEYLAAEAAAGRLDGRAAVVVLTHDPKFDHPLLAAALGLDVAYLGAMGSRRSHEQRVVGLLAAGVDPDALARLHSPIGLDLQAITPAEVAVSIAAQLVASRSPGATGLPLERLPGPIHAPAGTAPSAPAAAPHPQEVPAWT